MNLALPAGWFDQIERCVIKQYDALKLKGDIDNSVLAGFVLFNTEDNSLSVISLATGTKLLSGTQRSENASIGPIFVHDCHAEVLAHRALQCWIWDNLDSYFSEKKLPPHLSLHFYSSSPPCGDCCVHEVDGAVSVQTGAKPFGCDQHDLLRTPPNVVRGKPGRGPRSQSVSCSDKVCLWLNVGLEGSLLSEHVHNLKLSSVCIGGGDPNSCERCFFGRLQATPDVRIFTGKSSWADRNESPSASSFVWWANAPKNGEMIVGKTGRKYGVIEKRKMNPRFFSGVSDAMMMHRYCTKSGLAAVTLNDIKSKMGDYATRKSAVKDKLLSYGAPWCEKFTEERQWQWNQECMK